MQKCTLNRLLRFLELLKIKLQWLTIIRRLIVPSSRLKRTPNRHYLALFLKIIPSHKNNGRTVIIHILDTLIILQIPDFNVWLTHRDQYLSVSERVYQGEFIPMSLVDDTQLSLSSVNQVHIHVLGPHKQVILVFPKVDTSDVLSRETRKIVLLDERAVRFLPNSQVSVLWTRNDLVLLQTWTYSQSLDRIIPSIARNRLNLWINIPKEVKHSHDPTPIPNDDLWPLLIVMAARHVLIKEVVPGVCLFELSKGVKVHSLLLKGENDVFFWADEDEVEIVLGFEVENGGLFLEVEGFLLVDGDGTFFGEGHEFGLAYVDHADDAFGGVGDLLGVDVLEVKVKDFNVSVCWGDNDFNLILFTRSIWQLNQLRICFLCSYNLNRWYQKLRLISAHLLILDQIKLNQLVIRAHRDQIIIDHFQMNNLTRVQTQLINLHPSLVIPFPQKRILTPSD